MITQNELNKLIDLEKMFAYGGPLNRLTSGLARDLSVDPQDRRTVAEIDEFMLEMKSKLSSMRDRWKDRIKKQNEVKLR